MNSNQLEAIISTTLKKHFITINSFELKIDSRSSKGFKTKINLLISEHLAEELITNRSRLIEIMQELKNIDKKIIKRVQLYRSKANKWSIKLSLSKKVSKIDKFTKRRSEDQLTILDINKNILKNRLQKGNQIKFIGIANFTEIISVLNVRENTITLAFKDRDRSLPLNFFNNKQVLLVN